MSVAVSKLGSMTTKRQEIKVRYCASCGRNTPYVVDYLHEDSRGRVTMRETDSRCTRCREEP